MINIKSADLTNSTQKFIAALALGAVLVILYFLLPPLVTIFANLWLLAILAIPMLFLVYNYEMMWEIFKRMSWEMTKKIISSDKLWHMYRYHEYMIRKINDLGENIKAVKALRSSTERMISEKIKESNNLKQEALRYQTQTNATNLLKIVNGKVGILEKQLETFVPRLDFIKKQEAQLLELYDLWSADTELLKSTLDAKAEEYKLMKELSSASNSAMAFLQKDSPELKAYNESLRQIEQSVNEYTANIESFQRDAAPVISRMNAQSSVNEEEGAKLIEAYKAKRLEIAA